MKRFVGLLLMIGLLLSLAGFVIAQEATPEPTPQPVGQGSWQTLTIRFTDDRANLSWSDPAWGGYGSSPAQMAECSQGA